MLDRVPLLEKHLDDYAAVVGGDAVDRIRELAEPLQGARVLHVNATAYGGGVAELLATHVPLLRSIGIDADWQVMHGSDEFFAVTKAVHNGLQGADIEWTPQMQRIYLEKVLDNALLLEGHYDFVVVHDPQPAAHAQLPPRAPRWADAGHHLDLALPHRPHRGEPEGVGVLPSVRGAARRVGVDDARVRPALARHGARRARAAVHRSAVGEEPRPGRCRSARSSPSSTGSTSTGRSCARSAGSTRGRTRSV